MKFTYPTGKQNGPKARIKFTCTNCSFREERPSSDEGMTRFWCAEPSLPEAKCMGGDSETPRWCPRLKDMLQKVSQQLLEEADDKRKTVVFDPDVHHAHSCPFFEESLDQTACGEGWGWCRMYPKIMEDPEAELICPKLGPRGGPKAEAPDDCPLRTMELHITRKRKP